MMEAAYAFYLVRNHPYRDGNKRIGFLALVTFAEMNGRTFRDICASAREIGGSRRVD